MHVCGSHEQAIAKFGLRPSCRAAGRDHGTGLPGLRHRRARGRRGRGAGRAGVRVATYGDMLRVPGTAQSLADAQPDGRAVDVVYSVAQAVEIARASARRLVFFATGFETTAVATAAGAVATRPPTSRCSPPTSTSPR